MVFQRCLGDFFCMRRFIRARIFFPYVQISDRSMQEAILAWKDPHAPVRLRRVEDTLCACTRRWRSRQYQFGKLTLSGTPSWPTFEECSQRQLLRVPATGLSERIPLFTSPRLPFWQVKDAPSSHAHDRHHASAVETSTRSTSRA